MRSEIVAAWLLTLIVHAGVLLALAWIADRGRLRAQLAWRELLWRVALFGGLVTASAQMLLGSSLSPRIALESGGNAAVASADATTGVSAASSEQVRATTAASSPMVERSAGTARVIPQAPLRSDAWRSSPLSMARPSWQMLLIVAWLAGALIALARLGAAWQALRRTLSLAQSLDHSSIESDATVLANAAGIATPRFAVLDDLASPLAASGGRIVLPRWSVDWLDRGQLRAMLAHETAHLARRDPVWKLATASWCAMWWFFPLARFAQRRLDEIAELACDAWAAHQLGEGRSLATCLAECAERRIDDVALALAPAMAHRESRLLQRIDALIEGGPSDTRFSRPRACVAALVAMIVATAALPGFATSSALAQIAPPPPAPPAPPAAPKVTSSVHISSDVGLFGKHELTQIELVDPDGHGYKAKIEGKIAFNEREDDVASLSDGGTASFSEMRDRKIRRVDYSMKDGKLQQRYFVEGAEQPIDANARAWIAGILPVVIRETALDADARVQRLLAKGGPSAVLDEIDRINSDYARGVYLKDLAADAKLAPADVTRAIGVIDRMDSDYERRNALTALGGAASYDAAQQRLVLAQAAKIHSDYERAELLVALSPKIDADAGVRDAWLRAAAGIGSDYEHRRALTAFLEKTPHPDDATLAQIVEAAKAIHSDYERRTLLTAAAERIGDADRIAAAYAAAVVDLSSDYERREALLALVHAPKFGVASAHAVLGVADRIGSDYECSELLIAVANAMPADASLIADYRRVARRLSDYERGKAERALDRFEG